MSDYGPPPRRIVTTNVPISTAVSDTDSWEPAVDAIEEEVPRVSLLGGQAAKYPVFTHMQVPVNANAPWTSSLVQADSATHQGVNIQFLDLAPGAKVPLHRSTSVDYMIFLSGEVVLGVPEESYDPSKGEPVAVRRISCHPGDIVVQRGTLHYWENPSQTVWARYIGVGVRSEPLEVAVEYGERRQGDILQRPLTPVWYEAK